MSRAAFYIDTENLFYGFRQSCEDVPDPEKRERVRAAMASVEAHFGFAGRSARTTAHGRLEELLRVILRWFEATAAEPITEMRSFGKTIDSGVRTYLQAVGSRPVRTAAPRSSRHHLGVLHVEAGVVAVTHTDVPDGKDKGEEALLAELTATLREAESRGGVFLIGTGDKKALDTINTWVGEDTDADFWVLLPHHARDSRHKFSPDERYSDIAPDRVAIASWVYRKGTQLRHDAVVSGANYRDRRARPESRPAATSPVVPTPPPVHAHEIEGADELRAVLLPLLRTDWRAVAGHPIGTAAWNEAFANGHLAELAQDHLPRFATSVEMQRFAAGAMTLPRAFDAVAAAVLHGFGAEKGRPIRAVRSTIEAEPELAIFRNACAALGRAALSTLKH